MSATPRIILRIEISPRARSALEAYCIGAGKIKMRAMSQLVEWFASQPPMVQASIMNDFPPSIAAEANRMILKRILSTEGRA